VSAAADSVGPAGHVAEASPRAGNVLNAASAPSGKPRRNLSRPRQTAATAACGTHDPVEQATEPGGSASAGLPAIGASSSGHVPGPGTLAAASNRTRGPALLAHGSPCAGYFPAQAQTAQGEVQIAVEVDPQGRARASAVLVEQPYGQGFGSAARACAARLKFAPAVDAAGSVVAGQAKLKLRFLRPTMT
jgi:hypothetical protein